MREIDCASSPFEFSDQAYDLSCERADTQTHVGSSSGSVRLDVITISSRDRSLFLTMTSQVITAPRIYLEHRSLSQSFSNIFGQEDVREWNGVGNKGGYDIAEFKTAISGHESRCIATATRPGQDTSATSSAWAAPSQASIRSTRYCRS